MKLLAPGYRLRITPESDPVAVAGAGPVPLRGLWLDGYVTFRPREHAAIAVSGRASFQAHQKDGGPYQGTIVTFGRDTEASRATSGLSRFMNDPKKTADLAPDKVAALRAARQSVTNYTPADVTAVTDAFNRYAGATETQDRSAAEQQAYLVLQQISSRLAAADEAKVQAIKAALTEEEYAALLDMGRINPKLSLRPATKGKPATTRPTTRPRGAATRRSTAAPPGTAGRAREVKDPATEDPATAQCDGFP